MSKVLVTYFSASGVTAGAAEALARAAGADLYEIRPAQAYTKEDLDWNNKQSRSSLEMTDETSRPDMADNDSHAGDYDVVFIGFPIWWGVAPRVVNTFIESNDLTGKKIVIFATSGGSGIDYAINDMKKRYPQLAIAGGRLLSRKDTDAEMRNWVKELGL